MRVLYKLNLALGLANWPPRPDEQVMPPKTREILFEKDPARRCRRNILAVSGVVVLAGLAGADPRDLEVFGVKPSGERGGAVMAAAAMLAQLYWYLQRYLNLSGEATLCLPITGPRQTAQPRPLLYEEGLTFVWKGDDLTANRTAFALTLLSWFWTVCWIAGSA